MDDKKIALRNKLTKAATFSLFGNDALKADSLDYLEKYVRAARLAFNSNQELNMDLFLIKQTEETKLEFLATHHSYIPGKGHVYTVDNPHDCKDFKHLFNQLVLINGHERIIVGIEVPVVKDLYEKDTTIYLVTVKPDERDLSQFGPMTLAAIQELPVENSMWWPPCNTGVAEEPTKTS